MSVYMCVYIYTYIYIYIYAYTCYLEADHRLAHGGLRGHAPRLETVHRRASNNESSNTTNDSVERFMK